MTKAQDKPTLIYVGDPMCSWCYGYAPEFTKVKETFGDQLNFQLIMGGLRPYNTETMEDLGEFLSHHWKDVEERSGQSFNYSLLEDHSFVYDTEPPCRAVVVARSMNPEIEFDFFKAIQHAFYADNKNTNDVNAYLAIARQFKLNPEAFLQKFESEEFKQKVKEDFSLAQQMGANGFPTTILSIDGENHVIARGYAKANQIEAAIKGLLAQ